MTSKIIAVINQKGGVGKSTVAVNLAYGLSLKEKKTLIIDLDPQAHSSCIYCTNIPSEVEKTIAYAFISKKADINNLILNAEVEGVIAKNLDIIPSNIKLATVIDQISSSIYRERILLNHLKKVQEIYDYIILDCPPMLGVIAANAIYSADTIIIPTNFGKYSLDGMADLLGVVEEVKETQKYNFFVLRNLYEKKNMQTNRYVNEQLGYLNEQLLVTVIRKNEAINQSQINGTPVQVFNSSSKGAQDFSLLVDEIIAYY